MNYELNEIPDYNYELHGLPTGIRIIIGFTNVYYTLWIATCFRRTENIRYLQNLSTDFAEAQRKANERMNNNPGKYDEVEIDLCLRGESSRNFFRPLAAKRYAPELFSISRYAGTDMRTVDPNYVYDIVEPGWEARKHGEVPEEKKISGILWATYLNKEEKTIRGLRRRVIARQQLVKAGILTKVGRKYLTEKQIKALSIKAEKESAINGHHEADGARVTLLVKKAGDHGSFETQYGTTYIVTLIDDSGRLFKYMGSKLPDINETPCTIKATIKHDSYKNQPETKLQRIKII